MKFLLDMGMSPRTAEFLRHVGHDAVHLREEGLQRLPDEKIIHKAKTENRVILTFDLDFSRLLALQRLASPSVVLFRMEKFTTNEVHDRLQVMLSRYQLDLEKGAIVTIDSNRVRIRSLPVW